MARRRKVRAGSAQWATEVAGLTAPEVVSEIGKRVHNVALRLDWSPEDRDHTMSGHIQLLARAFMGSAELQTSIRREFRDLKGAPAPATDWALSLLPDPPIPPDYGKFSEMREWAKTSLRDLSAYRDALTERVDAGNQQFGNPVTGLRRLKSLPLHNLVHQFHEQTDRAFRDVDRLVLGVEEPKSPAAGSHPIASGGAEWVQRVKSYARTLGLTLATYSLSVNSAEWLAGDINGAVDGLNPFGANGDDFVAGSAAAALVAIPAGEALGNDIAAASRSGRFVPRDNELRERAARNLELVGHGVAVVTPVLAKGAEELAEAIYHVNPSAGIAVGTVARVGASLGAMAVAGTTRAAAAVMRRD